jgi:hypothetical protein
MITQLYLQMVLVIISYMRGVPVETEGDIG